MLSGMRKVLLVVAAASAVAVPTTVAVAGGEDDQAPAAAAAGARDATTKAAIAHKAATRAGTHGKRHGFVLRGLAQRLGVSTDELVLAGRAAVGGALEDVAVQSGLKTDALRACVTRSSACDRRAARRQARALHRDLDVEELDLVALKRSLATDLAAGVGKDAGAVLSAVRAELATKLSFAQTVGFIKPPQRELALGCFDAPASCDLDALHRAFAFAHRH